MNMCALHDVAQVVKCDYLFVTFSDETVRIFPVAEILRDRELMGKDTFFRVYGFDVDATWLRKAGVSQ